MKGVVFAELLSFVESAFSPDMVDDIIDDAQLPHDGAYTSVGTYPFIEMQRLTTALSLRTNQSLSELMLTFGRHLCNRFVIKYPDFFHSQLSFFDFIESVDRHIHVEVHKLYPDAELPRFDTKLRTADTLTIDYTSCRPLEDLAEGMIMAAADHYQEVVKVGRVRTKVGTENATRFTIRRAA